MDIKERNTPEIHQDRKISMSAPQFSKPFDIEHAKAGAPYGLASGWRARIFEWEARGVAKLIGMMSETNADSPAMWLSDGRPYGKFCGESTLVMLPLGLIDGKPVFVGDLLVRHTTPNEEPKPAGTQDRGPFTGWTWPAPSKVYPETLMSDVELDAAFRSGDGGRIGGLRDVANAALRHAIDAGQLIEPGDRAARDMAVAEAVRIAAQAARPVARGYELSEDVIELIARIEKLDLAAIIAKARP